MNDKLNLKVNPKQYLSQIQFIDERINTHLETITELKSKVINVSSHVKDDVIQTSSKMDFTDVINKIIDLEKEVNEEIDNLVNLKIKIQKEITSLDNWLYSTVLTKRYILNKSLKVIADELNYNYAYVRHVHGGALQEFGNKILNKSTN